MDDKRLLVAGAVLAAGAWFGLRGNNPVADTIGEATGVRFSRTQVYQMAVDVVQLYDLNADPVLLTATAGIESNREPSAYRYEAHIKDASYGMMQTLWGTAKWLQNEMGYRGQSINKAEHLYDGWTSMYFGAAYHDWLRRAYGGRGEQWYVRAYNGGPGGASKSATAHYWQKYQAEKQRVLQEIR